MACLRGKPGTWAVDTIKPGIVPPEALRPVVLGLRHPGEVRVLWPSSWEDSPPQGINTGFVKSLLHSHADRNIIFQLASGIQDESSAPLRTFPAFHHKGLQQAATEAVADMEVDIKGGWLSEPSWATLPSWPFHSVPQNMLWQGSKWRRT